MNWWKASVATAVAQAFRMIGGLIVIKIIAIYLGPEGFGQLGHFMSLIAILGVLAGGGVLNGIVKYVSEYKNLPEKLHPFLSNALAYSLIFSTMLVIGIFFSAKQLSLILFKNAEFTQLIMFLGVIQFLYGMVTFCNGTINGLRETAKFAKIIIVGTMIGLPASYYLIVTYGFSGAVIGLAITNACLLLPATHELYKLEFFKNIKISFNKKDTIKLSKFSVMQMFSLATLPLAEMYIRSLIIHDAGWHEAGLWQSIMRLSSVYVGFFTTFLAAYYMPTLSGIFDKNQIFKYVAKYVVAIGGIFLVIAVMVYIFRGFVFSVIFSKEFIIPSEYVRYQLIGDLFKIMSYVIGFLIVAKAKTKLYIMGELAQTALYLGVATWLIKAGGVSKVFPAYAISNFMYFSICLFGLLWFRSTFVKNKSVF
ncbi:MAG: O-antigen translocase [Methylococcaceae bacterium]